MPAVPAAHALRVDPTPRFEISPGIYMQFMEPLGVADGSINAAWDYKRGDWREDLVALTRELAPPVIRWPGGCLASYYRWREGVGPRGRRPLMHNLLWGSVETNHVGTHEYADFCRRVGAESLVCVNFESDGRQHWARPEVQPLVGANRLRSAGPAEAAAWVDYCNNPVNRERRRNGERRPFDIRLWQIGNETSYNRKGYDVETAARRTRVFAKAMRRADPSIKLIGWGDSGWARRMLEVNGDLLDYVAFHFGLRPRWKRTPLKFSDWRRDPALTWKHLMTGWEGLDRKIRTVRREVRGFDARFAITEAHWSLPGLQRCDVQATWAAGVSLGRVLNVFERHGDVVRIATAADYCGTQWMNNAVLLNPRACFMMPVARVMQLYRHHVGEHAVALGCRPTSTSPRADVRTRSTCT